MKKREFEAVLADLVADALAQLASLVRELVPYEPFMPVDLYMGWISEIIGDKPGRTIEVRWGRPAVQVWLRGPEYRDRGVLDDYETEPLALLGRIRWDADDLDAAARAAAREIVKAIEGMPEPVAAVLRALDRAITVATDQLIRAEEAWEVYQARAAWAMREIMARRAPRWPTGVEEEVE